MSEQIFTSGDADFSMWNATADEIVAGRHEATKALAMAAVQPLWPYLSAATTRVEFEHRMGMVEDGIAARVGAVIPQGFKGYDDLAKSHLTALWEAHEQSMVANSLRSATAGHVLAGDGQTAEVMAFPQCQICQSKDAAWDGKTVMGPWAYMCDGCHSQVGMGQGMGIGQKLELAPSSKESSVTAGEGARIPYECPNCGKKWIKKTLYGGEHCPKCKTKGEVKWKSQSSAVTAASHYIEYNEYGGVTHSIPVAEFEQMVKSPQNGWKVEKQDDGSYWASGPEGTGHRYVPWTSGGPSGGDQSKRGAREGDADLYPDTAMCRVCHHTWGVHDGLQGCNTCKTADDGTGNKPSPTHQFFPEDKSLEHKTPEGLEHTMSALDAEAGAHGYSANCPKCGTKTQNADRGWVQFSECPKCHWVGHKSVGITSTLHEAAQYAVVTPEGKPLHGKTFDTEAEAKAHHENIKTLKGSWLVPEDVDTFEVKKISTLHEAAPAIYGKDSVPDDLAQAAAKFWYGDSGIVEHGVEYKSAVAPDGGSYKIKGTRIRGGGESAIIYANTPSKYNPTLYRADEPYAIEFYDGSGGYLKPNPSGGWDYDGMGGIYHLGSRHTAAKATEADLQRIADFDHPFTVHADGSLSDAPGVYAPIVWHDPRNDIEIEGSGWEALKGFTGQYSYNGAVMHSSEYLGGGLADHILSTPGTYVVTSVEVHPEDAEPGEDPEQGLEPAGWAVLRRTGVTAVQALLQSEAADDPHGMCPGSGNITGGKNADVSETACAYCGGHIGVTKDKDGYPRINAHKPGGVTSSQHHAAQQCPQCRQFEAVWMPTGKKDEDGEDISHLYCRNCDYGIDKVGAVQALLAVEAAGQHTPDDDEDRRRQEQEDYDDFWRDQPGAVQSLLREAAEGWIDTARKVVANHQHEEVDGVLLDATTANLLVQVYDALSPANAQRFGSMPLTKATDLAWKMTSKAGAKSAVQALLSEANWLIEAINVQCDGCGKQVNRADAHIRGGLVGNDWGQRAYCKDCVGKGTGEIRTLDHEEKKTAEIVEQPTNSWDCQRCGNRVDRYRGMYDVTCPHCGAEYNASGQQLRDDWRNNRSNYDDDIGDMEGYENSFHDSARHQAVNENAEGTARYQDLSGLPTPSWITEWADEETKATKEMTEQGMNAYVRPNPFPNLTTLQQTRKAALKMAADDEGFNVGDTGPEAPDADEGFTEVGEAPEPDLNAATGEQPKTTKPRVIPGGEEAPHMVTIDTQIIPPDLPMGQGQAEPQMGSGGGFDMGYAPDQDPMLPTTEQMVAAKVARLTERIQLDNPSMEASEAKRLAALTVAKHPEMVKAQR